jgi:hypothetical protein
MTEALVFAGVALAAIGMWEIARAICDRPSNRDGYPGRFGHVFRDEERLGPPIPGGPHG